jgi:hypothetical protein
MIFDLMSKEMPLDHGKEEKKSFTIRIERSIELILEKVGKLLQLKSATVARNYLNLSQFIVVESNLMMKSYDNTPLGVIPLDTFKYLTDILDWDRQIDLGDRLGQAINRNCEHEGISEPTKKIELAVGWGWFKTTWIEEKEYIYIGIPRSFVHVNTLTAMVYRLVQKRKIPDWRDFNHFFMTDDAIKRIDNKNERTNVQQIREAQKTELGAFQSNYNEGQSAYLRFEVLKVKK